MALQFQYIMRSSRVVRASGCQCLSRHCPGFDPSIHRHSGICGAAVEAVLNNVHEKKKSNIPCPDLRRMVSISSFFSASCSFGLFCSIADPGCLSRIRIFSIPDSNCFRPGSRICIKELKYFNPKNCCSALGNMIRSSRILIFTHPGSRGQKKHRIPDPQHCFSVLFNYGTYLLLFFCFSPC